MKKKILASVLAGVIASLAILSLTSCEKSKEVEKDGYYEHPDYVAVYTPEENKARIEQRTAEKFAYEIAKGTIVNYKVEILYAFYDDDPEYFMVELEYANEFKAEYENVIPTGSGNDREIITCKTKWKYIIGVIRGAYFGVGLVRYEDFANGRNPYDYLGYSDNKKYYGGGVHAVDENGKKLVIYCGGTYSSPIEIISNLKNEEWRLGQYYISEEEEKQRMEDNFRRPIYNDY